ncbi:MAG: ferritin-like domain-containing protein [Deltaproteobacteria bacterium]|nr:ferritin-like domain-containing protein [Deltaproteobacteria bacterium]
MAESGSDVHSLSPDRFLEEVHSFEFWFHAVEGYLSATRFGRRPQTQEAPLSESERDRLITVLCHYCVGETAALEASSGLIAIAPNRLAKVFLATQVVDEGRHLEVLLHRLQDLGVTEPEQEIERRATGSLLAFKRRLLELVEGRDWEAAIFAQNVILESLEFTVFQAHAETADPVTRDVLQGIVKDERRHIGFGENELGRRLKVSPHVRARLAAVRHELDPLVLASCDETMAQLGTPPAERPEIGRSYLAAVHRLGFA